ncbi:DUF6210 family protein [Paenibacillus sp. CAU 1782]
MLPNTIPSIKHAERLALIIHSNDKSRGLNPFRKGNGSGPEGLLSFIEDKSNGMPGKLAETIKGKNALTAADADAIDAILRANPGSQGITVNRKKLEESMNGNLHVRIKYKENGEQGDKVAEADGMLIWNAR